MRALLFLTLLYPASLVAEAPTDIFEKAPPAVEKALRARVAVFFQAHLDGKFRQAEQVIHEDSKDIFYNSQKQQLVSYEITKIKYSDKFTRAEVVADVELDWYTARTGKMRVKPPMKSTWKLDKKVWWWYAIPKTEWETPWGVMKPASEQQTQGAPPIRIPDAAALLEKLTSDTTKLTLDSVKPSSGEARISNDMPGVVTLTVEPHSIDGLEVSIDKVMIKQGETAVVQFRYSPPDVTAKAPRLVYVRASPVAKVFSFTLGFTAPPLPPSIPLPKRSVEQ
ncbi:MAG: hypothetical protein H7039_00115 [Bryobacteraceae bacterium]|nr:hypothetical protein [Bryobacteraceae bacterium]